MDSKSLISIILCNLALNPLNHYLNSYLTFSPFLPQAPTTLHLSANHHVEVPADRALISIHVKSQGANQASVSDDIRSTQDDLMTLLRPLTEIPLNSSLCEPAITHLGVNTFSANSHRRRQTILGEKPLYEASAEYSVEFTDLDVLGNVYFHLTRLPRVKVDSIEWKLSEPGRRNAVSQAHQAAAEMLMMKARHTLAPLGLKKIRVVEMSERNTRPQWEWHQSLYDDIELFSSAFDELEDGPFLRRTQATKAQFEPKALGYQVQLDAKLEAS